MDGTDFGPLFIVKSFRPCLKATNYGRIMVVYGLRHTVGRNRNAGAFQKHYTELVEESSRKGNSGLKLFTMSEPGTSPFF